MLFFYLIFSSRTSYYFTPRTSGDPSLTHLNSSPKCTSLNIKIIEWDGWHFFYLHSPYSFHDPLVNMTLTSSPSFFILQLGVFTISIVWIHLFEYFIKKYTRTSVFRGFVDGRSSENWRSFMDLNLLYKLKEFSDRFSHQNIIKQIWY